MNDNPLEEVELGELNCPDCGGWGQIQIGQNSDGSPIGAQCERCRGYGRIEVTSE